MATVAGIQAQLTMWETCLAAISLNQSWSSNGKTYTRANLSEVKEMVKELGTRLSRITNGACVAPKFNPIR